MTRFANVERRALCDTFERVGPDAPTLCSPWLTRDLAAHLVVRERRPDAAAGIWVPGLARRAVHVQKGDAAWDWQRLAHLARTGAPARLPAAPARVRGATHPPRRPVHPGAVPPCPHRSARRERGGSTVATVGLATSPPCNPQWVSPATDTRALCPASRVIRAGAAVDWLEDGVATDASRKDGR